MEYFFQQYISTQWIKHPYAVNLNTGSYSMEYLYHNIYAVCWVQPINLNMEQRIYPLSVILSVQLK